MRSPGTPTSTAPRRADDWTSTTAATSSTYASITGLDQTGYQVRVSATNFEGDSGWSQITVGDLPNSPPTVSDPANTPAQYMFPFGEPAALQYNAPAGQDLDGDSLTYRLTVTLDQESPPEDALLSFAPNGDSFTIDASQTVTPQQWNDTHSEDGIYRRIPASLYAKDNKEESQPANVRPRPVLRPIRVLRRSGNPPGQQPVHRYRTLRDIRGT